MKVKVFLAVVLLMLMTLAGQAQQRTKQQKKAVHKTQKYSSKKGMTRKTSMKKKQSRQQMKGVKKGYGAKSTKGPNAKGINQGTLINMRDSLDRLLVVNTRSSAVLTRLGQVELYSSSQLSSMNYQYDRNGDDAQYQGKDEVFNTLAQISVGVSRRKRINVGLDANYMMYRHDNGTADPAFTIFNGDPDTQNSFGYLGPRVKVQPFRKASNFVYQTYMWLPLVKEAKRSQMGIRDWYWGNTFFLYHYFKQTIGVFGQANVGFGKQKDEETGVDDINFDVSVGLTGSYVLLRRNVFYVPLLYGRSNQSVSQVEEGADSDFLQCGVGYQRVFSRKFQANVSYNTIVLAHNYGRWQHVNLGFRFVF